MSAPMHHIASIALALPADRPPLAVLLRGAGACAGPGEAVPWSESYGADYWRAWDECLSLEWMLWLAAKAGLDDELRSFARWCARSVLHLWDPPAPEIVVRYLETGDESIRAAAWAAARAAAWAAARAAAWAAAWAAQRAELRRRVTAAMIYRGLARERGAA